MSAISSVSVRRGHLFSHRKVVAHSHAVAMRSGDGGERGGEATGSARAGVAA